MGRFSDIKKLRQEVIQEHNVLRAKHGSVPLKANADLEKKAQKWAEQLLKQNCLQHENNITYGQNLGMKGQTPKLPDTAHVDIVKNWYSEISKHNYNKDHQSGTGHFTQVVWKSSTEAGFGIAVNEAETVIFMCGNYSPAGNYIGQFSKNVFPPK